MELCNFDRYMQGLWKSGISPLEIFSERTYQKAEYQENIAPFIAEVAELEEQTKQYRVSYAQEFEKAKQTVVRTEYGTGSIYLSMGFYHPDPVVELVTINVKRGRILKKITEKSKPSHIYGFNEKNQLVTVERPADPEIGIQHKEVILNQGDQIWCLSYGERPGLLRLSTIEQFVFRQGRLCKRSKAVLYDPKKLTDVEISTFSYSEKGIDERTRTQIMLSGSLHQCTPRVSRSAERFVHDEQGVVSGFWCSWDEGRPIADVPKITVIPAARRKKV